VRDHHKCSQCDVQVTEDNVQYKQYVKTLEFLFPIIVTNDDVNTAGQPLSPTADESTSRIVITTFTGECTTIVYEPDQTILSVKDIIEQEFKISCNKQSLLYNDIELKVLCISTTELNVCYQNLNTAIVIFIIGVKLSDLIQGAHPGLIIKLHI
jgi:hypothetical protein